MSESYSLLRDLLLVLEASLTAAFILTALLVIKSVYDYSRTGPQIRQEIQRHFRIYGAYAIGRLAFWAWLLTALMALVGNILYVSMAVIMESSLSWLGCFSAGLMSIVALTALQFCRHLLFIPSSIAASSHYRMSHFYPLWRYLTPRRLQVLQWLLAVTIASLLIIASWKLILVEAWLVWFMLLAAAAILFTLFLWATWMPEPKVRRTQRVADGRPNILMIGCDTLRADRLGIAKYPRQLTPFIDSLARQGTLFTSFFVPVPRTAPSLISYMTGSWPQENGIRDNFVGDGETQLTVPCFPKLLAEAGYRTAVISDWSGSDFGKFPLGFQHQDLPADQWNLKYLLRQGPKDIRLFLSLFTHNRFGKTFLPEIYYLAGIPLGRYITRQTKAWLNQLAANDEPFLLNVFMATAHPPFGSEYPYYNLFSDQSYCGESKFSMARLTDPIEIIRSQKEPREAFDLQQIINLYDGSVRNFDGQVREIVQHLEACNLRENTILVIYSDHGTDFFENNTWGQGNSIFSDYSARVPVIISDPKRFGTEPVDRIVRSVDLAPTLLELSGTPVPKGMSGISLVSYLEHRDVDLKLMAYVETGLWLTPPPSMAKDHLRYPDLLEILEIPDKGSGTFAIKKEYKSLVIRAKDCMVHTERWKLVYLPLQDGPLFQLYDMVNDPECRNDVSRQYPEVVNELRQKINEWLAKDQVVFQFCANKDKKTIVIRYGESTS